ncbi:hypothetical protein GCM10009680_30020 [Streptomyces yatensis]|uniref:Transposase n=1 Tax=Streptomyces yatensis TaxID=155177 RepID=A0ABN2HII9_9ACTN
MKSTAYVEKVVKPPSTPVPKKGRTSRWAVHISVISTRKTPMTAQPTALTSRIVQGKALDGVGHSSDAP